MYCQLKCIPVYCLITTSREHRETILRATNSGSPSTATATLHRIFVKRIRSHFARDDDDDDDDENENVTATGWR
ncbi:hypothetical protein PUN28_004612 [Cardiocondyla obscurior]|uniref:Secreted protein n=1 Tax=Cardiocondyla obscurior TaxID=286306 RepID=A0AAW2GDF1_9HYME